MAQVLLISFDAVGDEQFARLAARPHFARLLRRANMRHDVSSVFLSNTYPVHTSVATGVLPARHGLVNNTEPFPKRHPRWCYLEKDIQAPTLWQAAAKQGLRVAAVLWPVTGGSKSIRWNIPELMTQPGENQILLNLRYGSKLLQIGSILRHGKLLDGASQPALDSFSTACMVELLRHKNPDLALVHLTAYDSLCHHYGLNAPQLETALDALDENLGKLLDAAGQREIIVFSDHAQLPAQTPIFPNELLAQQGYIARDEKGEYRENSGAGCFFECSGGSGFFHPGQLNAQAVDAVRQATAALPGFGRFLTAEELATSGRKALPFGFAAAPGYAVETYDNGEKANHGYPPEYEHYKVFILHAGANTAPGQNNGGSLLDIAPLAAQLLGIPPAAMAFDIPDGKG